MPDDHIPVFRVKSGVNSFSFYDKFISLVPEHLYMEIATYFGVMKVDEFALVVN
jgi:hypothetical protein